MDMYVPTLLQLAADTKLPKDGVVSASSQGPWEPVATVITRLRSQHARAEHDPPDRTNAAPTTTKKRMQLREAQVRRRKEQSLQFEQRSRCGSWKPARVRRSPRWPSDSLLLREACSASSARRASMVCW
jgi:hypothetical protein